MMNKLVLGAIITKSMLDNQTPDYTFSYWSSIRFFFELTFVSLWDFIVTHQRGLTLLVLVGVIAYLCKHIYNVHNK